MKMEAISSENGNVQTTPTSSPRRTMRRKLADKQRTHHVSTVDGANITESDDFDDDYDTFDDEADDDDFDDAEFHKDSGSIAAAPPSPLSNHHFDSDADALGDDEEDEIPLAGLFQKFLNREAIKSLQQRQSQLNSKLLRIKKVVDNVKLRERGQQLRKEKEKIKELIKFKKNQLNDQLNAPPFLRLMDKFAFTLGLIVLMVSEFVLLRMPEYMYAWYTILIFPLMAIRFFMYHRAKYHYFMLDFCYLCQFLLLTYLFGHQAILGERVTPSFFKLVFALSNGPLAWGCIIWRNSMVFHDVDKLTSVFIHLCPPIVTFCLRWYPLDYSADLACGGSPCELSYSEAYVMPILLYFFWQAFYIIKTEYIDEVKLANDQDIMTSLRWMSIKQPHPVYTFLKSKGINCSPVIILICSQLVYTFFTLLALPLLIRSFILHSAFLFFIFVAVSWNGACYYFEVFSESYSKRFNSDISNKFVPPKNQLKISSFYAFLKFMSIFFVSLFVYLKLIL